MKLVENIDIENGIVGGIILGTATSVFMYLTGKVTGLSGIAEGIVSVKGEDWNFTYIAGLCSAGALLALYRPDSFGDASLLSSTALLAAGAITGFGTRLGGGCTSGHGLCGLPRRSPRSLAAVLTFMTTGAITAYLSNLPEGKALLSASLIEPDKLDPLIPAITASVVGLYVSLNIVGMKDRVVRFFSPSANKGVSTLHMHVSAFASSLIFGLGLGLSGMCNPARVIRFLDFSGSAGWDPTLASVLGGGCAITFMAFHYFKATKTPVPLNQEANLHDTLKMGLVAPNLVIDWRLLLGSALFGVGWGLAGICPGPGMVAAGAQVSHAMKFVPGMFIGMIVKELLLG